MLRVERLVLDAGIIVQQRGDLDDLGVGAEQGRQPLSIASHLRDVMGPDAVAEDVVLAGTGRFDEAFDGFDHGASF